MFRFLVKGYHRIKNNKSFFRRTEGIRTKCTLLQIAILKQKCRKSYQSLIIREDILADKADYLLDPVVFYKYLFGLISHFNPSRIYVGKIPFPDLVCILTVGFCPVDRRKVPCMSKLFIKTPETSNVPFCMTCHRFCKITAWR